ncbi:MAG: AAA family ATPase, partial [Spirosomataceae bacterium]
MLTHLSIKNYLLIDNLELNLSSGLTIITGETGAGKSILLGAIGLLLGQRAETKVLFDSQTKCIIEGTFAISGYSLEEFFNAEELDYSETTLIRREISPAGKSRAFVNDTPVTLDVLKKITEQLVDIHSQHDSILLGEGAVQIELMDAFAGNSSLRSTYSQDFKAWKQAEASLENLVRRAGELRKEHDYDRYLWEELDKAQLIENEIEELEKELAILENAAEIKTRFIQAYQNLEGSEFSVLSLVNEASQLLYQVNRMTPVYKELSDRLEDVLVELKDLSGE